MDKKNKCRHHKIEGIADGFIPIIVLRNINLIDEIIKIRSNDAINVVLQVRFL